MEERAGDRELLPHPLAERAGRIGPAFPEAEQPEQPLGALGTEGARQTVETPEVLQVRLGRELVIEAGRFGEDADAGADGLGLVANFAAAHVCPALGRRDERGEHPDRRRLPGTVRAEEAENLARADFQGQVADRPSIAEAAPEPIEHEHRCGLDARDRGP